MCDALSMRLGISLSSSRPGGGAAAHTAGAQSIIERARAANRAELDSLTLGDHHAMSAPYYQNTPMLGRLLADWAPERPVGCLFLLPLWHPVLVAEHVATLATMSDAPFIVQTGIGSGGGQFRAMGASLATRGADLEESIRVISALLAGQIVDSEHFGISGARVSPLPPHGVEWWMGGSAPVALRRAASIGDAWYAAPSLTPESMVGPQADYERFCSDAGRRPRIIVRTDVLVLADGDRARRLGDAMADAGYRGMQREQLVYGSVDDVTESLAGFAERGVEEVMVRCMSTDQAEALETIECCGRVRRALA